MVFSVFTFRPISILVSKRALKFFFLAFCFCMTDELHSTPETPFHGSAVGAVKTWVFVVLQ
jgi:hypothetical protein